MTYTIDIFPKPENAPEEVQNFLDLDHEGKRLWIKNKIISLEVQA
ncbi:TPA: hypothetical protein ACGPB3_000148 [Streptococcus suis]